MLANSLMKAGDGFKTYLFTSDVQDISLKAVAGNPTVKGKFRFIVNPGVVIGQVASQFGAINVDQFPVGSTIELWNYGSIQGRGGAGGTAGNAGGAGGDALNTNQLNQTVRIYNYGEIKAGGGGGGGGGYGGAGGLGGWGNIISTTGWTWYADTHSQFLNYFERGYYATAWSLAPTPGGSGGDSRDTNNVMMLSGTQMLYPYGILEAGAFRGTYNEGDGNGNYYSYEIRFNYLQPAGAASPANIAGPGGAGAGYNQARTSGSLSKSGVPGGLGSNGSGAGGTSGATGAGGNGGDWATAGGAGAGGSTGGDGGGGVYSLMPVSTRFGKPGGDANGGGAAGRAIVKGSATVTVTNNGTIVGATV